MDVPEHHRFCPMRDPIDRVKRVSVVVWPPFGRRMPRVRANRFPASGCTRYRGLGKTAAQYRERHGLQRTAGLINAELHTRIQDKARAQMASPAGM
jgi:hypothetical protein